MKNIRSKIIAFLKLTLKLIQEFSIAFMFGLLTTLYGVYSDDVNNYLFGGDEHKWIKKTWCAEWEFSSAEELQAYVKQYPSNEYQDVIDTLSNGKLGIVDNITIEKIYGNKIKGQGHHSTRGNWSFTGTIEHETIRCEYNSEKGRYKKLSGVFFLRFSKENPDIIIGKWMQNSNLQDFSIIGGATRWQSCEFEKE